MNICEYFEKKNVVIELFCGTRCKKSYQTFFSAAHHHDLGVGFKLQQAELRAIVSWFPCKQRTSHCADPEMFKRLHRLYMSESWSDWF